jgi:hypothetical protein
MNRKPFRAPTGSVGRVLGSHMRSEVTSAANIMTGLVVPMTARTIRNTSDSPICQRVHVADHV